MAPEVNQHSQNLTNVQEQELHHFLQKYDVVFLTLGTLPPHKIHGHRIPLVEGSKLPNSRPYKYGLVQKVEIEKCVHELLKAGFIRVSNCPYSSPLILVRKKEGMWRRCMDYR